MKTSLNRGLPLSGVIWCAAIAAALLAAILKGTDPATVWPLAAMASFPALIGIILSPFARKEWAQMIIIFSWIALAILACFAVAYVPMALLFLCAPAAAALFEREKVVEAMLLAAIFAGIVYYAQQNGYAPSPIASAEQGLWSQQTGVIATIAFLIGAMFFASSSRAALQTTADASAQPHSGDSADAAIVPVNAQGRSFEDAFPGNALRISQSGAVTGSSRAARKAFGLAGDADMVLNAADILSGDETSRNSICRAIDKAQKSGKASSLVTNAPLGMKRDDEEDYIEIDFVPGVENGDIFAFIKPWKNIPAKPEIESEALAEMRRRAELESAEKTLFFAGVSHELRTPLNAIIGFSDMMRSRLFGPLPGKYAEYAELIHDSGQHMLDLIGDVLDLSKVEAGKYELQYDHFDAADVVRSSVKMLRPSADAAQLSVDVDIAVDQDLLIHADRRAVRQILLNLLSNAIKFTPQGGRIKVSAKTVQDVLNIKVEDNGLGMSPEELSNIGKPYAQVKSAKLVKARGSGLGLSLVKTLTELHNGRFAVTSHPGAGTSVNIYLPTEKPHGEADAQDER